MRKFIALAAIAACTLPAVANAQENDARGLYIAANVGKATLSDVEVEFYDNGGTFGGTGAEDSAQTTFDVKSKLAFGGAIGYDFGMIRAEIEGSYSRHKVNTVTIDSINGETVTLSPEDRADVCSYLEFDSCTGTGATFDVDGLKMRQAYAMANLWVDLPVGDGTFVPYAGGGLGVGGFEADGEGKAKLAYQLGAGVAFRVAGKTFITADWRHRRIGKTDLPYDDSDSEGVRFGKVKSNVFGVGARIGF